jgi:hypothetical protein
MEKLFSAEFWSDQWPLLIPLALFSMALGWWLRGAAAKPEIANLERINETLEQRLDRAQGNNVGSAAKKEPRSTA